MMRDTHSRGPRFPIWHRVQLLLKRPNTSSPFYSPHKGSIQKFHWHFFWKVSQFVVSGADSKLRFSLEPPTIHDGVEEWKRAMRIMARLPGGIPNIFRNKVSEECGFASHFLGGNWTDWTFYVILAMVNTRGAARPVSRTRLGANLSQRF